MPSITIPDATGISALEMLQAVYKANERDLVSARRSLADGVLRALANRLTADGQIAHTQIVTEINAALDALQARRADIRKLVQVRENLTTQITAAGGAV